MKRPAAGPSAQAVELAGQLLALRLLDEPVRVVQADGLGVGGRGGDRAEAHVAALGAGRPGAGAPGAGTSAASRSRRRPWPGPTSWAAATASIPSHSSSRRSGVGDPRQLVPAGAGGSGRGSGAGRATSRGSRPAARRGRGSRGAAPGRRRRGPAARAPGGGTGRGLPADRRPGPGRRGGSPPRRRPWPSRSCRCRPPRRRRRASAGPPAAAPRAGPRRRSSRSGASRRVGSDPRADRFRRLPPPRRGSARPSSRTPTAGSAGLEPRRSRRRSSGGSCRPSCLGPSRLRHWPLLSHLQMRAVGRLAGRLQARAARLVVADPLGQRRQQVEELVPLAVDLLPRQLDHPPLGVEVEHADVGLGPVLDVVHQGVEGDLEQVVARLAGRRQLVVDDPVVGGPPVVEDVVEDAGDADRLAARPDLERHVDPAPAVAEELVEDLAGRLAAGEGVGRRCRPARPCRSRRPG